MPVKRKLLVAYSCSSTFVVTTRDYLDAFRLFSDWDVHYVHAIENAEIGFDFSSYDAIFHNYCARFCFDGYVSPSYIAALRKFDGVKVIAVQDEYDFTDKVRQAVIDIGFDIFLTCVPEQNREHVYPKAMFPKTQFIQVLTGYVPNSLLARSPVITPLHERQTLIGYRGRDIGSRYGRLGFEKLEIGRRVLEICRQRGIAANIAWDESGRLYGNSWFEFLGSCRTVLGSESGSNIFDFDGKIAADHAKYTQRLGRAPTYQEFEPRIRDVEKSISMGQISPRVFEAAAVGTPMIMYEGDYSGVVKPGVHYLSLNKDFSNIDDVLDSLSDLPLLERIAARARTDLVTSNRYSYAAFVTTDMSAIQEKLQPSARSPSSTALEALQPSQMVDLLSDTSSYLEPPTTEPLSGTWYQAQASWRIIQSAATDFKRMMTWGNSVIGFDKPLEQARKRSELTAQLSAQQPTMAAYLSSLRLALQVGSKAHIEAAQKTALDSIYRQTCSVVDIALDEKSTVNRIRALVSAPWIEANIPALKSAKAIRYRIATLPGVKHARGAIKRRAPHNP